MVCHRFKSKVASVYCAGMSVRGFFAGLITQLFSLDHGPFVQFTFAFDANR